MNECQSLRTQKALTIKQKEKINEHQQKKPKKPSAFQKKLLIGGFLPCLFAQENMLNIIKSLEKCELKWQWDIPIKPIRV